MENLAKRRQEAKRSLIYDAHWKECICETLRSIYDDIHLYPDPNLKRKLTKKLVDGMVMVAAMQDRIAYLAETYKDSGGTQGMHLKLIPDYQKNKLRRRARMKQ